MSTTPITQTGKKGDIRIAFGFMRVQDRGLPEPCLHLFTLWNKQVLIQIPACEMHRFDERDRDPRTHEPACLPKCQEISDMLYGQPVAGGAHRVLDAITEWLTDIKNLPPPSTYRNTDDYLGEMRRRGFDVVEH
jgi:hypothetical protein